MGLKGVMSANYRVLYNPRVDRIGQRVLQGVPTQNLDGYKFSFQVIDEPVVNAFAYPGGPIFITNKLLDDLSPNDDEVAAILGHEIGHVIARYSIKQVVASQFFTLLFDAFSYEDNDGHEETFGEALGELLLEHSPQFAGLSFSRANEYEADDTAWTACSKIADCDPRGGISMFEKLMRMEEQMGYGGSGTGAWWASTHPATQERIEVLKKRPIPVMVK